MQGLNTNNEILNTKLCMQLYHGVIVEDKSELIVHSRIVWWCLISR
jgi:hypothetical protein